MNEIYCTISIFSEQPFMSISTRKYRKCVKANKSYIFENIFHLRTDETNHSLLDWRVRLLLQFQDDILNIAFSSPWAFSKKLQPNIWIVRRVKCLYT